MTADDLPPDCAAFAATVNAVLDGDAPAAALRAGHPLLCRDCRELAAAARLLAAAGPELALLPRPSPLLRDRLVRASLRTRRRRWPVPALAAGLVLAIGVWAAWPTRPPAVVEAAKLPAPRVADQWAAVAGVARTAGEKVAAPARLLSPPDLKLPATDLPARLDPAADALTALGQAAKAGAEPVAGTTRRAVGLFLRDFGLAAKPSS
jgi:hypothetical protein